MQTEVRLRESVEVFDRWSPPQNAPAPWIGGLGVLLFALLAFGPLAFGAVEYWSQLVLRLAGAALALASVLVQLFSDQLRVRFSPRLHIPMLALAVVICAQFALGRTAYYEQTVQSAANWAIYGVVLLASSTLFCNSKSSHRVHVALGAFGFVYAVYAIAQHFAAPNELLWGRTPEVGGDIFGAYVNRNHYAGLMEMLAPLALVAALRTDLEIPKRVLFAFFGLLMAGSVFLSGSRAGMLALIVQLLLLAFVRRSANDRQRWWFVALVALLLIVIWLGGVQVAERIGTLADTNATSSMRVLILQDGLRMFVSRPFLGWGLGVFQAVYPQYRSFYTDEFVNQAHNDYLQLLIETGLLGFVAFVALLWGALRRAVAELDLWQEDAFSNLSTGAMLGVVGLLIHSWFDFNLQIPANALMFFALCGIAARNRKEPSHEFISQRIGCD